MGIYKIQSIVKPERVYIGSTVSIKRRWLSHLIYLRKNKHPNRKLQRHYNKYGETDLKFFTLLECERDKLVRKEQCFMNIYKPWFNICKVAGSSLGRRTSNITKLKLSKSHIGKNTWMKGSHPSRDTLQKMKESSLKGKDHPMYGKHHSEETKKKMRKPHGPMSEENKQIHRQRTLESWVVRRLNGKDNTQSRSEEFKQNCRKITLLRYSLSNEFREKQCEGLKEWWRLRKLKNIES